MEGYGIGNFKPLWEKDRVLGRMRSGISMAVQPVRGDMLLGGAYGSFGLDSFAPEMKSLLVVVLARRGWNKGVLVFIDRLRNIMQGLKKQTLPPGPSFFHFDLSSVKPAVEVVVSESSLFADRRYVAFTGAT